MQDIKTLWSGLGARARLGLTIGVAVIVAACLVLGYMLTRTRYEVLFSDLAARESAAILATLEKDKVPYLLSDREGTISVPADLLQKVRLKLAGSELPIQGGVGFELFNNNEVGMTDFAQKINYQRALQGELTRTIMALDEVQSARVHLALPEQGLFRRAGASMQPKASVALTLKPGRELRREQTRGIQRLVAAAIPDVKPEDVTVLDQRGLALTAERAGLDAEGPSSSGVDGKRESEDYLGRKVRDVLDQMFGPGQSIARIDVVLNQDHTKVTTETVLPANAGGGQRHAGVLVREVETGEHEARASATGGKMTTGAGDASPGVRSRDVQYQVGRRVEQIVTGPGMVSRINVAVVVRRPLDAKQTERLRELVAASIGFDRQRGDSIAIHSIDQILGARPAEAMVSSGELQSGGDSNRVEGSVPGASLTKAGPLREDFGSTLRSAGIAVVLLSIAIVVAGVWGWRRRRATTAATAATAATTVVPTLSAERRDAILRDIQSWMGADAPVAARKP